SVGVGESDDSPGPTSTGTVPDDGASHQMPKNATSASTRVKAMMTPATLSPLRGLESACGGTEGANCGGEGTCGPLPAAGRPLPAAGPGARGGRPDPPESSADDGDCAVARPPKGERLTGA